VKLAHRDFRPPRRSKYVLKPLKRRPTLRILFLGAIGVAVYWKFDSVVSSPAFQSILKPASLMQSLTRGSDTAAARPSASLAENRAWSRDSGYLEATCDSPRYRECLDAWKGLAGPAKGELRALISKASVQWGLEPDGGFTARYLRVDGVEAGAFGNNSGLELSRLDLRTSKGIVSLSRVSGRTGFCANGKCLDELRPSPPFAEFSRASASANPEERENRTIEAMLTPLQSPVFRPVLDGRIVDASPADSSGSAAGDNWVKLYHGRNLFSHYRGFSKLRAGLRPGSMVRVRDTLGYVEAAGDSLGALGIRIEKDGLAMDPIAFLGLGADSTGAGR
jgi:hypothetical protein